MQSDLRRLLLLAYQCCELVTPLTASACRSIGDEMVIAISTTQLEVFVAEMLKGVCAPNQTMKRKLQKVLEKEQIARFVFEVHIADQTSSDVPTYYHFDAIPQVLLGFNIDIPQDQWVHIRRSCHERLNHSLILARDSDSGGLAARPARQSVGATAIVAVPVDDSAEPAERSESVPVLSYDLLRHDDLLMVCRSRDAQVARLNNEIRALKRRVCYWQSKAAQAGTILNPSARSHMDMDLQRKGTLRLTVKSGIALAIRRNLSCIAAADLGKVLMDDVTGKTVLRWEVILGGTIIERARSIHSAMKDELHSTLGSDAEYDFRQYTTRGVAAIAFRSDATNSAVLRTQKVHATEAQTRFVADNQALRLLGDVHNDFDVNCIPQLRCVADLLPVTDASAAGTLALVEKQLKGVGIPSMLHIADSVDRAIKVCERILEQEPAAPDSGEDPRDAVSASAAAGTAAAGTGAPPLPQQFWKFSRLQHLMAQLHSIYLFMYTSDAGSDQTSMRKIVKAMVDYCPYILYIDLDCLKHQVHLAVKTGLLQIDAFLHHMKSKWKYYSSLAKLINVWREKAQAVFNEFLRRWGPQAAMEKAFALPPRCISGRWGSVSACQAWLSNAGGNELTRVLEPLLASPARENQPEVAPLQDAEAEADLSVELDAERVEAQAAYRHKMNRWHKETLQSITDPLFWLITTISSKARQPLDHAFHFLEKKLQVEEVNRIGNHVAQLTICKAAQIASEFELMVMDDEMWNTICQGAPEVLRLELNCFIMAQILHHATAWDRRVRAKVEAYPFRLFFLIASNPNEICKLRGDVAKEVLTMEHDDMEVNTLKLRTIFRAAFEHVAANWTFIDARGWGPYHEQRGLAGLYIVLKLFRSGMLADVQAVEGLNSLIKAQVGKAPSISLELLSSRLTIKSGVGVGSKAANSQKWSTLRPSILRLHDECAALYDVARECVLSEDQRFAPICDADVSLPTLMDASKGGSDVHQHQQAQIEEQKKLACGYTGGCHATM